MKVRKSNDAKLYHLSYDAKETANSNLKTGLTWIILHFDITAYLHSPAESTILIESERTYSDWQKLLDDKCSSMIFYAFSEVAQSGHLYNISDDSNYSHINEKYKTKVEEIRNEIRDNRSNSLHVPGKI